MIRDLKSSLSPSAQKQYLTHWKQYCTFVRQTLHKKSLPSSSYSVALYTTKLHKEGLKSTTIRSRLSAIAFYHKVNGHRNPTTSFLTDKLLCSYKKSDQPTAVRKPITKKILTSLLNAIQTSTSTEQHDKKLYKALFSIMYEAALRSSEVCVVISNTHYSTNKLNNSPTESQRASKSNSTPTSTARANPPH
jgi:site-specific recombinase XerC